MIMLDNFSKADIMKLVQDAMTGVSDHDIALESGLHWMYIKQVRDSNLANPTVRDVDRIYNACMKYKARLRKAAGA